MLTSRYIGIQKKKQYNLPWDKSVCVEIDTLKGICIFTLEGREESRRKLKLNLDPSVEVRWGFKIVKGKRLRNNNIELWIDNGMKPKWVCCMSKARIQSCVGVEIVEKNRNPR